jgi:hypothetical protein
MTERVMTAARTAAALIEQELKAQSPSRKIGSGLFVTPSVSAEGVEFSVTFADGVRYGIFLDRGTGRYRAPETEVGRWNPNPGKGTGGIIPRFFTVISDSTQERVAQVLGEAYLADLEEQILNELE